MEKKCPFLSHSIALATKIKLISLSLPPLSLSVQHVQAEQKQNANEATVSLGVVCVGPFDCV